MLGSACRWVHTRLPLLAGDDLVGPERRWVERHLAGCAGCRERLESLREALGALHAAASGPVAGETARLWPGLSREIRESRRPLTSSWSRRLAVPVLATAAVAALVAVAGVLWSVRLDRRTFQTVAAPAKAPVPVRRAVEQKVILPHAGGAADDLGAIALDAPTKRRRPAAAPAVRRATAPAIH
jgi:anti-sigma factor RsiW